MQLILSLWIPLSGLTSHDKGTQCPYPSFLHRPAHGFSFLFQSTGLPAIPLSSPLKRRYLVKCSACMQRSRGEGKMTGEGSSFLPEAISWRWAVREPERSEVSEMNERNTQITKQSAAEDASSALAKSLLSFHPFSPNTSCPLIPCYSAVKNKTSLRLSVFLFFPRVGLITGD